jgi:hypothetical protein
VVHWLDGFLFSWVVGWLVGRQLLPPAPLVRGGGGKPSLAGANSDEGTDILYSRYSILSSPEFSSPTFLLPSLSLTECGCILRS